MRFIPTAVHGVIDYAWGVILLGLPFALGFVGQSTSFWTAFIFGVGAIGYALVTDYELGLAKVIPMPVHLALDAVAGLALLLSPLVLDLDTRAQLPFMVLGALAIVASLTTKKHPGSRVAVPG